MNFKKILSVSIGIIGSLFLASNALASRNNLFLKVKLVPTLFNRSLMTISRFRNSTKIDKAKIILDDYNQQNRELILDGEATPKFIELWDNVGALASGDSKLKEAQKVIQDFRFYFNHGETANTDHIPDLEYVIEQIDTAQEYIRLYHCSEEVANLRRAICGYIMEIFG